MAFDGMINNRHNGVMGRGQGGYFWGRGRGGSFRGGRFSGPPRRGPLNLNARSTYGVSKSSNRAKPFPWKRDLFDDSLRAAGLSGVENGTKLYISNLDVRVSNEDIRELFSEFGQLRRHAVHYGQNGRPNGSAEVIFARKSDALNALKRYNDVLLDGKPMQIEIIGSSSEVVPVLPRVNVIGNISGRRTVTMPRGRGGGSFAANRSRGSSAINRGFGWRGRGGLRKARGQIWGRGGRGGVWRKKVVDKSADELDKELESYHADAMQT